MIVHLALFTPKPDLDAEARAAVGRALEHALTSIPVIVRSQVGRRLRLGTAYDQAAPIDFEYCVLVELATRDDLGIYLAHPAHDELGRYFYSASVAALASDFETVDHNHIDRALDRWSGD